jgi:hypothetical protein
MTQMARRLALCFLNYTEAGFEPIEWLAWIRPSFGTPKKK